MFLKQAGSSQSKVFPWLFSWSLAQHTLSQATLNKQTHTHTHMWPQEGWGEILNGMQSQPVRRPGAPQQAWWVNTSKATKTMSSWARKMQSVGSLGSQSKLVFLIRMGRAVIKSPTGTKLRLEYHEFSNFQGSFLLNLVLQSPMLSLAVRVWKVKAQAAVRLQL